MKTLIKKKTTISDQDNLILLCDLKSKLSDFPLSKQELDYIKKIKKGDTIMIVEAMKTMNHVPSTADGIVKEICVEDGQPVEYGQTIIILE